MSDFTDETELFRWTRAKCLRLRALWLAWYRVSKIAAIFGIKPSRVSIQAYHMFLPHRPLSEFHKHRPIPELEVWPPLPSGGRPSELWPDERVAEFTRLRQDEGWSYNAIEKLWGEPYTKAALVGKGTRLGLVKGVRFFPPATFLVPKYLRMQRQPLLQTPDIIALPFVGDPSEPLPLSRVPPGHAAKPDQPLAASSISNTPQRQEQKPSKKARAKVPVPAETKPLPKVKPKGFYIPSGKKKAVDRSSEDQEAIAVFLAEQGVTRCPATGTPGLAAAGELRWDKHLRKFTRRTESTVAT